MKVTGIAYIGKESNDLEEAEVLGVGDDSYVQYQNYQIPVQKILDLKPKEAKKYGFNKTQLLRIKHKIRFGNEKFKKKTILKLAGII